MPLRDEEITAKVTAIAELEHQVREYVNSPRRLQLLIGNVGDWNQLCSAMDAIGDAEVGIDGFLSMSEPEEIGEVYVAVYGVLQLLYVEQDAVKALSSLLDRKRDLPSEVWKVRKVRNASIGHPTCTKDGASHFIVRATLSVRGFQMMSRWPDGRTEHASVNLRELIQQQRNALAETLEAVVDRLREEEKMHRERFTDKKLSDIMGSAIDYHASKISEGTLGSGDRRFGGINLDTVIGALREFEESLGERGLQAIADDYIRELDHPLRELRRYYANDADNRLTDEDAYIFGFFVKEHLKPLQQIAQEIDAEYAQEPRP